MSSWTTIADRWIGSRKSAGVHVRWVSPQQCVYTVCLLEQRKQLISIVDKKANITSKEELLEYLTPAVPVYLSIEGKGILVREIAEASDNFLQDIIPDARAEDFYTVRHPQQMVSVVRRNVVDQLVRTLAERGLFVLAVHTGPFALNTLLPFLPDKTNELSAVDQHFTIEDRQIKDVRPRKQNEDQAEARYTIGEEQLSARYLLAYATALTHFIPENNGLPQEDLKQEFCHRQLFIKALPVLLGFFLVILLVNAAVYMDVFQKNQELIHRASSSTAMLEKLTSLQQEVTDKKKFLATLGWERPDSKVSLADRLAATVPTEIVLTDLQVSPMDEGQYKKEKRKVFDNQVIRVSGRSEDILALNEWLSGLEALTWVNKLENQQYIADQDDSFGSFSFTLRLQP